jgi:hypothetical protein
MLHTDQNELEEELFDDIADSDYIFVINAEGNLKSIIFPDEIEFPENVEKVMNLFNFKYSCSTTIH